MSYAQKMAIDLIKQMPDEKILKLLSFANFIKNETVSELDFLPGEEEEIEMLLATEEKVDGNTVLNSIFGNSL